MDLEEILRPEYMTLDLRASDKESAIRELISLLAKSGTVSDESAMFDAVMHRESEFSTGIGMGIAIPHAKCEWAAKPAVAFGRKSGSITWTGEETTEVNLIFLIAVPMESQNQHLKLIAAISRKLVHEEVRRKILGADDVQGVIGALKS